MMDEKPQLQPQNGSFHSNGGNRGSRPSSIYDNFKENGQSDDLNGTKHNSDDTKKIPADLTIENEQDRSPTQEFLLKTTVPQNLAAVNLAGRHTPTRNSLRHSRMIVMSRTGTSKGYFSFFFFKIIFGSLGISTAQIVVLLNSETDVHIFIFLTLLLL